MTVESNQERYTRMVAMWKGVVFVVGNALGALAKDMTSTSPSGLAFGQDLPKQLI